MSVNTDIDELFRRVAALEANPSSGGGIRYDFDNEGDWLYVVASDPTAAGGSPQGYTIQFRDFATPSAFSGIDLQSSDGEIIIGNTLGIGSGLWLASSTGIGMRNSSVGELFIENNTTDGIRIEDKYSADGSGITIRSDHGHIQVTAKTTVGVIAELGDLTLQTNQVINTGVKFSNGVTTIFSNGGAPLLEILWNGLAWEYHIVTGSSWVADL